MANPESGSSEARAISLPAAHIDIDSALEQIQQDYRSGRLHRAQRLCRDILQRDQDNETVIRQLGVISHRLEDFATAKECFFNLIRLHPDDATVYYNLGHTCIGLDDADLAFAAFAKTVELDPERASAYNNMGVLLEQRGDYEDAIDYFYEASALDPDHALSRMHLSRALNCVHRLRESNQVIEGSLAVNTLSPEQRAELLLRQAQNSWLGGDTATCHRVLRLCEHVLTHVHEPGRLAGRYALLQALLQFREQNPACYELQAAHSAYYFGSSHALVAANTHVELDDVDYRIESFCVENATAADFACAAAGRGGAGRSTASFAAAMEQVPDKSWVLLDFGEPLCRRQGGLFELLKQHKDSFDEALTQLVKDYVDYVEQHCARRRLKLVFVGVPANNCDMQQLSVEDQHRLLLVTEQFNSRLEKQALGRGLHFLDLFTATVGGNGRSNRHYHLDDYRLRPDALGRIVQEYLLSPGRV